METVVQPKKLFKILNVKVGDEDASRILNSCFGFLLCLKQGQQLHTNSARFEKISSDLIMVDHDLDLNKTIKSLENMKVIRIPV